MLKNNGFHNRHSPFTRSFGLGTSLALDFIDGTDTLDPRITFTRSTTATFTNSAGLIATAAINAPRFDYDPVTLQPKGLLIEEQRTNLLTYSEQFDDAAWSKNSTTVTANTTAAPNGSATADTLANTATTAAHSVSHPVTTVSGNTFTMSFFVKKGTVQYITIGLYFNASNNSGAGFDLDAGTVTGTGAIGTGYSASNATINSVGNGWYRISVVCTIGDSVANTARLFHRSVPYTSGTLVDSYAGLISEESFIWGAQLEAASFATSYIPTVASQVTRAADNASMTGTNFSSWYNQNSGTMFVQYVVNGLNPGGANAPYGISDNTTSNSITSRTPNSQATNFAVRVGGVFQANLTSATVAIGAVAKSAGAYALDDFKFSTNAAAVQTDTSGTLPIVTQMQIGGTTSSVSPLNGTISRIAFYPRVLADSELQGITA